MEGLFYGIFYSIKTITNTYENRNIGGFKTMQKGNEMVAKNVEPNFWPVVLICMKVAARLAH